MFVRNLYLCRENFLSVEEGILFWKVHWKKKRNDQDFILFMTFRRFANSRENVKSIFQLSNIPLIKHHIFKLNRRTSAVEIIITWQWQVETLRTLCIASIDSRESAIARRIINRNEGASPQRNEELNDPIKRAISPRIVTLKSKDIVSASIYRCYQNVLSLFSHLCMSRFFK